MVWVPELLFLFALAWKWPLCFCWALKKNSHGASASTLSSLLLLAHLCKKEKFFSSNSKALFINLNKDWVMHLQFSSFSPFKKMLTSRLTLLSLVELWTAQISLCTPSPTQFIWYSTKGSSMVESAKSLGSWIPPSSHVWPVPLIISTSSRPDPPMQSLLCQDSFPLIEFTLKYLSSWPTNEYVSSPLNTKTSILLPRAIYWTSSPLSFLLQDYKRRSQPIWLSLLPPSLTHVHHNCPCEQNLSVMQHLLEFIYLHHTLSSQLL